VFRCSPSASASCGTRTLTTFGTSAAPPPCPVFQCYPDYYDATPSVAADATGHVVVAYTFSTVANGPKSLYTVTSGDGLTWTTPHLVNSQGDSNFPQIASGPAPGDFRLAWQDNRTGAFNTWYTTSSDGAASWTGQVKLSNRTSGAPYKSPAGYTFPDGDYFGIAVSSAGSPMPSGAKLTAPPSTAAATSGTRKGPDGRIRPPHSRRATPATLRTRRTVGRQPTSQHRARRQSRRTAHRH
jgi:hypothetical protein